MLMLFLVLGCLRFIFLLSGAIQIPSRNRETEILGNIGPESVPGLGLSPWDLEKYRLIQLDPHQGCHRLRKKSGRV